MSFPSLSSDHCIMTPSRHMFGVIDPDPHPLVHFLPVVQVEEHEVVEEELILRLTDVQGIESGLN